MLYLKYEEEGKLIDHSGKVVVTTVRLGSAAEAKRAGRRTGIATGVVNPVKSMQEGRSDDHEGRI